MNETCFPSGLTLVVCITVRLEAAFTYTVDVTPVLRKHLITLPAVVCLLVRQLLVPVSIKIDLHVD